METKNFNELDIIFSEGSDGVEMYRILTGKVKIYKTINQEKVYLGELSENEFFGELQILLGLPRSATVQAVESTELQVITKETFVKNIQKNPEFALKMVVLMAKRLKEAHGVISKLEGEKRSFEIMYKAHN